ncbi:DoxX family protein [Azotobacter armeniacus]
MAMLLDDLIERRKDALILLARILLMGLFLLSGWGKLTNFSGTVAYMASLGAPLPWLAALIAVVMEVFVALALVVGFLARPLALLFALFVLGTALLGHRYWTLEGADRAMNMVQFYKNLCIIGGLLLLAVTGPGKYAVAYKGRRESAR